MRPSGFRECWLRVDLAWRGYGSLPWSQIVEPALELAKTKIPLNPTVGQWLAISGPRHFSWHAASRKCFLKNETRPLEDGELYDIPYLGDTFECLSREGAKAFYEGGLGRCVC